MARPNRKSGHPAALAAMLLLASAVVSLAWGRQAAGKATPVDKPLPDVRQLMQQVVQHQRQLEKIRENYTYKSKIKTEEIDAKGVVKKVETEESEIFFINSHRIVHMVKKDEKPLSDHDQKKEQERVDKLIEKAQHTPPGQAVDGPGETVSITHLLDIMEMSNPRRENFRGRTAIHFDFAGRKDAKTHGLAEDASKKIAGTIWIDEKDLQVMRMEAHFSDNFHVGGGLLANIAKGSSFYFDQTPVNGEIWFPSSAEAHVEGRVLLLKGIRQHYIEYDYDYQRFHVDAEQQKTGQP